MADASSSMYIVLDVVLREASLPTHIGRRRYYHEVVRKATQITTTKEESGAMANLANQMAIMSAT